MSALGDRIRARLAKRFTEPKEEHLVADGLKWVRARGASAWRPREPGEVLVGVFEGMQMRNGEYGVYQIARVRTEDGMRSVSGTVVTNLIADAVVEPGTVVRIVFNGEKPGTHPGWVYRDFALFLAIEEAP